MIGDNGLSGFPTEKGQRGDVGPPGLPGKKLRLNQRYPISV